MSALITAHASNSDWCRPYVKPSATWETLEGYEVSLGLLLAKPPSATLEREHVQGYLAGLLEGEGYFYYTHYLRGWYPCVYVRMCEAGPVRFFSQVMNVSVNVVQRSYVSRVKGLRAVLLARTIGPMLVGKRRLASELFANKGYRVVNSRTLDEYSRIYRSAKRKLAFPIPLRQDDIEKYPAF